MLRCNKFNPGSKDIFEFQVGNSELFGTSEPTSKKCFHKNQNDISSRAGDIPNFVGFHFGRMPTIRLTDIHKIQNRLELTYQECLRKIPERYQI